MTRLARKEQVPGTARDRALARRIAALVLDHPDERLLADLPVLRRAASELPEPLREGLLETIVHLEGSPLPVLAEDYVEIFDIQRRCCLYLTYYAHGETRNRGAALLSFASTYRTAGFLPPTDELSDHLCVVLEFAATVDPATGERLLLRYRAGLELLRLALLEEESPYAGAVAAVSATLPPPTDRVARSVVKLAAEGPPGEQVGLAPFAPQDTGRVPQ
nr:nitrate reductase molybdenum cofactor assembly chaperone [Nocardiopsis algeriensis]